jgi:hypothetical protein
MPSPRWISTARGSIGIPKIPTFFKKSFFMIKKVDESE